MTFESHLGVGRTHSLAIVDNLYERSPGIFQDDVDLPGTGIERVLHQLLNYRRRPLYNLSRCNLVGYGVGQQVNYICHFPGIWRLTQKDKVEDDHQDYDQQKDCEIT